MKRAWILIAVVAVVVGLAGTAQAQKCEPTDVGLTMTATPEGDALGAAGAVKGIVLDSCREALGILVLTPKLADGAWLTVEATTAKGTFKVASMTVFLGIAEIFLDSDKDVTDLFPLADLERITVRYPQGRSLNAPAPILLEAAFVK